VDKPNGNVRVAGTLELSQTPASFVAHPKFPSEGDKFIALALSAWPVVEKKTQLDEQNGPKSVV
jgi:hypothetical protein